MLTSWMCSEGVSYVFFYPSFTQINHKNENISILTHLYMHKNLCIVQVSLKYQENEDNTRWISFKSKQVCGIYKYFSMVWYLTNVLMVISNILFHIFFILLSNFLFIPFPPFFPFSLSSFFSSFHLLFSSTNTYGALPMSQRFHWWIRLSWRCFIGETHNIYKHVYSEKDMNFSSGKFYF